VLLLAVTTFLAIADKPRRLAHILYGLGALLLFGGLQTAFRLLYYGDFLPNTYYLKVEGVPLLDRIARGLYVFWQFAANMNLLLFLAALAIVLLRRAKPTLFLACLFLAQP